MGKLFILCNTVEIFFSSIPTENSPNMVENTERLTIFYKFILGRCQIMQMK